MSESNPDEVLVDDEPSLDVKVEDDISNEQKYSEYQVKQSKKIVKEDINKLYEPWTIIDTYFRDTDYYKTQQSKQGR